ncbi:hypothetical protein BCR44DRAFT_1111409 [Catenaria anguillulae PL171]|uniref:Uncharacterized protein n=1 Tax=Catenaria anguillulae PL171 TaxID=765915 RepID=A0A1Y2H6S4_9FUNG|nr:hypothetical protein BCR44DRAFT_1111409 [Catenaria anguillulae PL171]
MSIRQESRNSERRFPPTKALLAALLLIPLTVFTGFQLSPLAFIYPHAFTRYRRPVPNRYQNPIVTPTDLNPILICIHYLPIACCSTDTCLLPRPSPPHALTSSSSIESLAFLPLPDSKDPKDPVCLCCFSTVARAFASFNQLRLALLRAT